MERRKKEKKKKEKKKYFKQSQRFTKTWSKKLQTTVTVLSWILLYFVASAPHR